MIKKLFAFTKDFWMDGSALLGAVAAPLSIAFTLAKVFNVSALSHLNEISYAWALAPLLLWVFVAYVRRRARTDKSVRRRELENFYVDASPIISRKIPKDVSDDDFEAYVAEADRWTKTCADYINQEMGHAARERFVDKSDMMAVRYSGAVNDTHNIVLQNLNHFRKNLRLMIEDGAWD